MRGIIIFVIFACLGAAIADEAAWKAKLGEICKECGTTAGLSESEMQMVKNANLGEPTDKIKVFANCILEKTGIMKDGAVQEAKITELTENIAEAKKVDKEKVAAVFNECKVLKGADKNDTSFKVLECLHNKGTIFGKQ